MNLTWTSAGIWLLHTAVGGGLLLLLTWLLMRWTRQPALRQRLGEFGLAAAMAVAVFSMAPAWLIVKWPASPVEAAAAAPEVPSEPVVFQLEEGLPGVEGQWHVAGGVAPPLAVEQPAAAPPAEWIDWRETAIAGLVCAFIVGASWTLGRWVLGWLVLGRLLSRARPASADVAALFDDLTEGQIRARLLVSGWLRVPVSCGLLNPTVLVPAGLCAPLHRAKLRWVLAHELTHLERRDAWSCLLFGIGQAFFFYLPWFWMVRRQVRLCQEYVADAAAVAAFGADAGGAEAASADYAEFLLSLTTAPAVPVATTGVSGNKSDLFRRVSMLLEQPLRVERRAARRYVWLAAAALLALGVVVAGVGVRAEAADVIIITTGQSKPGQEVKVIVIGAGKEEGRVIERVEKMKKIEPPKKGESKKEAFRFEWAPQQGGSWQFRMPTADLKDLKKTLEKLHADGILKKEQMDKVLKALEKAGPGGQWRFSPELFNPVPGQPGTPKPPAPPQPPEAPQPPTGAGRGAGQELRIELEKAIGAEVKNIRAEIANAGAGVRGVRFDVSPSLGSGVGARPRLGIRGEAPSAILIDQLNLPKHRGLVIVDVRPDSAAAKAGIKVNDVLLKLGDNLVTNDSAALGKLIEGLKPGATVSAVILRKGKEVTVEGLVVPQATGQALTRGRVNVRGAGVPGAPDAPTAGAAEKSVVTTTKRTGDRFTTRFQGGTLTITVTGTIADGKAKAGEVVIQDGGKTQRYNDVQSVPAQYRDRVSELLQLSGANATRADRE